MFYHPYSLVSHSENFRQVFDKEMHAYLFLQKIKNKDFINHHVYFGSLPFWDLIGFKSCPVQHGKWKFIADQWDYSCGVYQAIEFVRQAIVSAMKANKQSVDVVLVFNKENCELLHLIHYDQELDHYIDVERSAKRQAWSHLNDDKHESCKCGIKIAPILFFKFIKPVLKRIFDSVGLKIHLVELKNLMISQKSGPSSSMYFKRDLQALRIEWIKNEFVHDRVWESKIRRKRQSCNVNIHVSACERAWPEVEKSNKNSNHQAIHALAKEWHNSKVQEDHDIADWINRKAIKKVQI